MVNRSWTGDSHSPSQYLRSFCCLLFGTLTVSWVSGGPTFFECAPLIYPLSNRQHINLYICYLTTNISRILHKVVQGPAGGLNKELSHLVQLTVIKGNGTHCLSLILFSSQLGHALSKWTRGAEYEYHSYMSYYYGTKLEWDVLIGHLGLCM